MKDFRTKNQISSYILETFAGETKEKAMNSQNLISNEEREMLLKKDDRPSARRGNRLLKWMLLSSIRGGLSQMWKNVGGWMRSIMS